MTPLLTRCVVSALAALAVGTASAQTAPSAPSPASAEPRFTLKEVVFAPTVGMSAMDLQAVVQPFVGRDVGTAELDGIALAIRRLYEARGLGLVGIGFPSQGLRDGVLQVTIVEPRIVRTLVESPGTPPVSDERTTW